MKTQYSLLKRQRLENAVCVLCPIIERKISKQKGHVWTEYLLRRELVACILGSQVRYEMATKALRNIEKTGLLDDKWWFSIKASFEHSVFNVLSGQTHKSLDNWCYRFPKIRAHQISKARNAIVNQSLTERVSETPYPIRMRHNLVNDIAGIGPKQASMFLRNIGKSYDLAILDTHVLFFMYIQNMSSVKCPNIGNLSAYERVERVTAKYADKLGIQVGFLDWAIWATMRAAVELGL